MGTVARTRSPLSKLALSLISLEFELEFEFAAARHRFLWFSGFLLRCRHAHDEDDDDDDDEKRIFELKPRYRRLAENERELDVQYICAVSNAKISWMLRERTEMTTKALRSPKNISIQLFLANQPGIYREKKRKNNVWLHGGYCIMYYTIEFVAPFEKDRYCVVDGYCRTCMGHLFLWIVTHH